MSHPVLPLTTAPEAADAAPRRRDRLYDPLHEVPLRLRLVLVMVTLLVAALTIAGFAATYRLQTFLVNQKADEMRAAAAQVARVAYNQDEPSDRTAPTFSSYFVAVNAEGTRPDPLLNTPSQPGFPSLSADDERVQPVSLSQLEKYPGLLQREQMFTVLSQDKKSRYLVAAFLGPADGRVTQIAIELKGVDKTVERMRLFIVFISLLAAIACALLGWYAIRRAFRPLIQIEDTAKAIAAGDLSRRVPDIATQDEVSSLSSSLNVMLSRIEESFTVREASEERMRRFVADASHELRTPLATVRGYAELFRQGAVSSPEDVGSAMRRIEDEATRMGVLVDDLLLLTRLERRTQDPGEQRQSLGPVDLTVIAADSVQDARALDHDRQIKLVGLGGSLTPTVVFGDESRLRQVVTNLMANAIRYTPPQTPIELAVGVRDRFAELHVRDHGEGVPPEVRHRIFERFFRSDASRNRASGGSGLGLAIVAAIVTGHSGTVHVEETEGGGATFIVRIPQVVHSDPPAAVQPHPVD